MISPFDGIKIQQKLLSSEIRKELSVVGKSCQFIGGPGVEKLERDLASFVGTRKAIACASGTDALILALRALNIGRGDTVVTTPMTFAATAEAICLVGATPIFVDIDPVHWTLDPESVAGFANATTKCIIAVDLFGQRCDYQGLSKLGVIIEDAAQSLGAAYHGRKAGNLGVIGCTSFYPTKVLGCWGDGGMCFTNSLDYATQIRLLARHGEVTRQEHVLVGMNSRLDAIQAAILNVKFRYLVKEVEVRNKVASWYKTLLQGSGLTLPQVRIGSMSAWPIYSVLAESPTDRVRFQGKLLKDGIPTDIFYRKPLHLQKAFAHLGYKKGDLPISEDIADRIFTLPIHPYMDYKDCLRVADSIHSWRRV